MESSEKSGKSEELIKQLELFRRETDKEKELKERKKDYSRDLGGYGGVFFVKLKDDGEGIFKPKNKEREFLGRRVEPGTYYKRERAAYLVDRFLGFNLVPPTVIREIDGEIGSFQEFIPEAKMWHEIRQKDRDKESLKTEMFKLWIFDFIIWNSDRHESNFLLDKNGKKAYAIDNGLSFTADPLILWKNFDGEPVPIEIQEKIKQFSSPEDKKSILKDLLKELLPEEEVTACFKRIEKIAKLIEKEGLINDDKISFNG